MKLVVTGHDEIFGPWISARLGRAWLCGIGHTVGLIDSVSGPVACALYESFNGASVLVHLAIDGRVNREFLWFMAYYPFVQLGCNKVICPVEADNEKSIRFVEHYGLSLEARLVGAARCGDLLLYTITRDSCKWLEKYSGKTISAEAA